MSSDNALGESLSGINTPSLSQNSPKFFSFFRGEKLKEEEVIFNLIKMSCEENGSVIEDKVFKMAQLLNIHPDKYQKIKTRLIESGKISKNGQALSVL